MSTQLKSRLPFAVYFVLILFCMACQPMPNGPTTAPITNNSNQISNHNSNSANSNTSPKVPGSNLSVTMPVIDAMFADETFATEAQSAVNLTDEELMKLQNAARDAVLQLNGDPSEDEKRSTKTAIESTTQELEQLLGKQKATDFVTFVQSRWAGEELALATPNSIPTDSRIVVNAPAYRMDLFREGKLIKTYKIGIGYPEFPIPTGLRQAKAIIFNPTWTPPDEPWVKGKVTPGKKVEAGSELNPLGPIKIPIGSPSLIHGGKNVSRLGTFASHGCVGLTNASVQDFAIELAALSETKLSSSQVKEFAKTKDETKSLTLTSPIPVELRYETIVAADAKVYVYRDVYELGTNTEENLTKVLAVFGISLNALPDAERSKLLDAVKQMAVDADGNSSSKKASNSNDNSERVTRSIKGKKEIVVEVAALKGKGYPAPVKLVAK